MELLSLPLPIALILTVLVTALEHLLLAPRNLGPLLISRRRLAGHYALGTTTIGLFLSWHQYHHPAYWWHFWAFAVAAGLPVVVGYALRWIQAQRSGGAPLLEQLEAVLRR